MTMLKIPSEVAGYFPYATVRPHQDQFIKTIFDAVQEASSVLIEGSNGLGKTISAISACLLSLEQSTYIPLFQKEV